MTTLSSLRPTEPVFHQPNTSKLDLFSYLKTLAFQFSQLKSQFDAQVLSLQEAKRDTKNLNQEKKIEALSQRLETLIQRMEKESTAQSVEIQALRGRVQALEEDKLLQKQELDKLNACLQTHDNLLRSQEKTIDELKQRITKLEKNSYFLTLVLFAAKSLWSLSLQYSQSRSYTTLSLQALFFYGGAKMGGGRSFIKKSFKWTGYSLAASQVIFISMKFFHHPTPFDKFFFLKNQDKILNIRFL